MKSSRFLVGLAPLLVLVVVSPVVGQWDTVWTRTFGGTQSDRAYAVRETRDGGFVIVGLTESTGAGSSDCVAIRTDESGRVEWQRTFGGPERDSCYAVGLVPSGGFVLAGETRSFGAGDFDVWLLRLNEAGDTLWTRTFGGPDRDWAEGVVSFPDGSSLVAGGTRSFEDDGTDAWLIRVDSLGAEIWSRTIGGEGHQWSEDIVLTADGHFLIPGWTAAPETRLSDAWLVKIDSAGRAIWRRTYDAGAAAKSVAEIPGVGYMAVGVTDLAGPAKGDFWLLLADSMGTSVWTTALGKDRQEWAFSVAPSPEGGAVVVGRTYSEGAGDADVWLATLDAAGNVLGTQVFGGPGYELATYVTPTRDGGFVVVGFTESFGAGSHDIWLLRLSPLSR